MTIAYKGEDENGDPKEKTIRYNIDPSWDDEVEEFADAIINNKKIMSGTSNDAYKTMELVSLIYGADPIWKEKYL